MADNPVVIIIGGPNGAGKSTTAPDILDAELGITEFVNADVIARGLSAFAPERSAIAASRIMLQRLDELAAQRANFAFETTLASRSFAPWIENLVSTGYEFRLVFLSLPSADLSVARVALRVSEGGHHVPEETIRRRFAAGHSNFFRLYRPLATTWRMYDNALGTRRLVASGAKDRTSVVVLREIWDKLKKGFSG
ncbi:MAG: zeta toxin family protein [Planctomycetia bacterium]|nr:zeta toxin family protein [Planctomycetia bacterium]